MRKKNSRAVSRGAEDTDLYQCEELIWCPISQLSWVGFGMVSFLD